VLAGITASEERRQIPMADESHLTKQALSRRAFLRTAAVGSAALAGALEQTRPTATLAAAPSAQSDQQVLHVAFEGSATAQGYIPGMDTDPYILPFVFMTPVLTNNSNEIIPWLATAVTPNADNTVFTIQIDPRAVWSDGKPVTASDLKAWYDWIATPAQKSSAISLVFDPVQGFAELNGGTAQSMEGVVAKDDHTLEYHLTRSEPFFPSRLALPYAAVGRVDQYKADPTNVWLGDNAKNLIVNGPLRPTALNPEPEGTYIWEQNSQWWGDKKPTLTRIEGQTVRDFQTMLLLFENGQIDMAYFLSGDPAVQLRKEKPDVFKTRPAFAYFCMDLDTSKAPLDDLNLRQALLRAIDWDQMANVSWQGEMPPTTAGNLLPPGMPCRDDSYQPYPLDVNAAKDYLSKSSYGSGDKVPKIRVSTEGSDPPRQRAAQILQEFWRVNLGIENVEIKNVEAEFGAEQNSINIYTTSAGANLPVPALLLQSQGSSKGTHAQFTKINVPELDQGIAGLLKMDPQDPAYCPEVTRVLKLLQDQAVVIPLAYIRISFQVQPWLQNADVNINSTFYTLMDMSIQK
jgi:ABC-type transport system substrate-binding protein